ncbi:MAG: hypothetical protein ACTSRP_03590 [Candidatus Helarchaeota archaeon]
MQNILILRNKIVYEKYELTQKNEEEIKDAFVSFLYNILLETLKKTNIINEIKECEYNFLDKDNIKFEIRRFLHIYLGEKLKFDGFYGKILLLIVKELKLEKTT